LTSGSIRIVKALQARAFRVATDNFGGGGGDYGIAYGITPDFIKAVCAFVGVTPFEEP
jgi:hypothetical protein